MSRPRSTHIALGLCLTGVLILQYFSPSTRDYDVRGVPTPREIVFATPMHEAARRVTKKPFGIFVSPANSPVSPERFTGYHVGVDFETTPQEQALDVPFFAICTGPLLDKRTATGYGGVVTQSCVVEGATVTVIYGHIKLSSVDAKVGYEVAMGQRLGVLGDGMSAQTGGERKHLHLGVYAGSSPTIRGYESSPEALSSWMNVVDYFR